MTENKSTFKDLNFQQHKHFPAFDKSAVLTFSNGEQISVSTGELAMTSTKRPYEVYVDGRIHEYQTEEQVNELMLINQK